MGGAALAAHTATRVAEPAQRRGWWMAALWLCVVFVALEHGPLFGEAVPLWDARDLHAPNQILVADHARAGRLLFWNPWTQGGSPDFADPQTGSFSPVSVALGLVTGGTARGFMILWLAHWLLGGLGVLALAARLGASPAGALVPAFGWLYCGLYVGQAQHVPILISFSYLPWILARLDVAVRERRVLPALQSGALWGLSALYGYPAMTILDPAVAAAWALLRGHGAGARRAAAIAFAFGAVGLVVLAPAYAAILRETRGFSDYVAEKPRDVAVTSDSLAPGALATLASPYLLELKLENRGMWPRTDVTMSSLYCGAATAVLALFALAGGKISRFRLGILALAALSTALALGGATPLRGWLYDLIPPTRYFRHAALFRVYAMFSLVVLAVCGSIDLRHALARDDRDALRRLAGLAGASALLAIFAFAWVERQAPKPGAHDVWGGLHVAIAWIAMAFFAAVAPALERRRRGLAAFALLLLASADAAATHALSPTVYTEQPGIVYEWRSIERERSSSLDLTPRGLTRTLQTDFGGEPSGMNVALKRPTLRGFGSLRNRFHERWLAVPVLVAGALQVEGGPPRTWFASDAAELPVSDAAWDAFAAHAAATHALPLVVHRPEAMVATSAQADALPDLAAFPSPQPIAVRVDRYVPDELALEVDAPAAGWLLVTDRWSRSWRASVDDREVPVYGGDFVFRALRVHAGANRVRFHYEPAGYLPLVAASWSALAIVAALSLSGWRR